MTDFILTSKIRGVMTRDPILGPGCRRSMAGAETHVRVGISGGLESGWDQGLKVWIGNSDWIEKGTNGSVLTNSAELLRDSIFRSGTSDPSPLPSDAILSLLRLPTNRGQRLHRECVGSQPLFYI